MIQWEKTGRQVGPAGRTVRYRAKENPRFEIESRKRPVPHANGVGSWDYTSYWVMVDGQDVKERHSLREAKEWAEAAMEVAAPAEYTISALAKRPGEAPRPVKLQHSLEALQRSVGGYIEAVTLAADLVILCNEEGRLKGKPFNCVICGVDFVGDILLVGREGMEFADLPEPDSLRSAMPGLWTGPEFDGLRRPAAEDGETDSSAAACASAQNDGTGDPSPTEDGGPLPLGGRAAPTEGNGREDGRQIAGATGGRTGEADSSASLRMTGMKGD